MTNDANIPSLITLEYIPYINEQGQLPEIFQGKIGVYAIFDQNKSLQFIGYSRDVYLSLKQHLIRQPEQCYWVKIQTIERPSRTLLESIENAWISESGISLIGSQENKEKWTQPINVKNLMTPEEQVNYQNPANDELAQMKILKNVARRVESEIFQVLESRSLQMQLRFNPKLKEEGLLDLKS